MIFFRATALLQASRKLAISLLLTLMVLFSGTVYSEPELVLNAVLKLPFSTKEQTGFLDRLVSMALSRMGYQLKTVSLPAERALRNINTGVDDGDMSRVEGLEELYPNMIRVPEKVVDMEFTVFSQQTIDLSRGWQGLQNLSVSYINGWKVLEKNVPKNAQVTTVRDANQLFMLLKKRRVELVIYERWSAMPLIQSLELVGVRRQTPPLVTKEMFIYLHKKHSDLVPLLAAKLKQLKREGIYEKLAQELLVPWERRRDK